MVPLLLLLVLRVVVVPACALAALMAPLLVLATVLAMHQRHRRVNVVGPGVRPHAMQRALAAGWHRLFLPGRL